MDASLASEALRKQLVATVDSAALTAFDALLASCAPHWEVPKFLAAFTTTARTLGRAPLASDAHAAANDAFPLREFTCDIAGRALLLCQLASDAPERLEAAVIAAYREGDTLEKIAVVRALALLPEPERFAPLALDAGRTNELGLFRALACDNPFPARHYSELAWNKLLMKAAFLDLPLERMWGASERDNAELSRMALHYIEQQESAGRTFPPQLWAAVAAFPPPSALAKLLGYTSHAVAELRLGAAVGLARAGQARTASFVRERLTIEPDARVRAALERALAAASQA